jgi:hypothetical protein
LNDTFTDPSGKQTRAVSNTGGQTVFTHEEASAGSPTPEKSP